jgi:hypothetical protein
MKTTLSRRFRRLINRLRGVPLVLACLAASACAVPAESTPEPTGPEIIDSGVSPGGAAWMRVRSTEQPQFGRGVACDVESEGVWICLASA